MQEMRPWYYRAVHWCMCLSKTQTRSQAAKGSFVGKTHEDRNGKAVGSCYAIVKRSETCAHITHDIIEPVVFNFN